MSESMGRENAVQKERAVSNARVFFISMVLFLQLAVLSAKGVETLWPIINLTTPPLHKWVWGGLALVFLIWALVTLLTAYSSRLGENKLGRIVEKSFVTGAIIALSATGIGLAQGFVLAIQARLDGWYPWVILILGLAFYIMYAVLPAKGIIARNVKRLTKTAREFFVKNVKKLRRLLNRGV